MPKTDLGVRKGRAGPINILGGIGCSAAGGPAGGTTFCAWAYAPISPSSADSTTTSKICRVFFALQLLPKQVAAYASGRGCQLVSWHLGAGPGSAGEGAGGSGQDHSAVGR